MDNTIESLFVERYLELEMKAKLVDELRFLFNSLRLEYNNGYIRATKVFNEDMVQQVLYTFDLAGITISNREEFDKKQTENEKKLDEKENPKIQFRDVVAIVKKRLMHTDASLADKIGVTQSAITGYRNGKCVPRKDTREKILELWEKVATTEEKKYIIIN